MRSLDAEANGVVPKITIVVLITRFGSYAFVAHVDVVVPLGEVELLVRPLPIPDHLGQCELEDPAQVLARHLAAKFIFERVTKVISGRPLA